MVKDAYPIPRIDESLSKLGDVKFFYNSCFKVGLLAGTTQEAGQ